MYSTLIHPFIFCTVHPTQFDEDPGIYPKSLRAQVRSHNFLFASTTTSTDSQFNSQCMEKREYLEEIPKACTDANGA